MASKRSMRLAAASCVAVFVLNILAPGSAAGIRAEAASSSEGAVSAEKTTGFSDVQDSSKYYYKPVKWAADNKVTYGYKDGTFKPENVVTRAQMVTFLWRLCGSPEPKTKKKPFSDIKKSDYWYKPAIWGNENGIVMGYKDGTFGPKKACTRAQAVTFMYRMSDQKDHLDGAKYTFKDLKGQENKYYYKPAYWGMKAAIVVGLATDDNSVKNFNPQGKVTRGQMVTFLYKLAKYSTKTAGTGALKQNVMHTDGTIPQNDNNGKTVTPKVTVKPTARPTNSANPTSKASSTVTPKPTTRSGATVTPDPTRRATVTSVPSKGAEPTSAPSTKYSYEIIPMLEPFNLFFFVKTDNPDPDTFCFVDKDTKYSDEGTITPLEIRYEDVVYEDRETGRVKGGYICSGSGTDGGTVYLRERTYLYSIPCTNLTTGEVTYDKEFSTKDTDISFKVKAVKSNVDYLIDTYASGKSGFFEKLGAVQSGLDSICLYSSVYVLGELYKSGTYPYNGLSTSPHADQNFYLQDPYSRKGNKSMLISNLYPYIYDSIGFPAMMSSVAKKLEPSAECTKDSYSHYTVHIAYNGETRSFGGAGYGGGQGINKDQILYRFRFDNSSSDAYKKCDMSTIRQRICEYGELTVDEDQGRDLPPLKWAEVRDSVGDGKYLRLIVITSIYGSAGIGYSYMYDNGKTGEGRQAGGNIGYFSNAWFDGRYFNKYEFIQNGTTFDDTLENNPSIVIKDFKAKLPDDGKQYLYYNLEIEKWSGYDSASGTWTGYTTFKYDVSSKTWVADFLKEIRYWNGSYADIEDADFIDACTITLDEAKNMNLDRNTDKEPSDFLIYDMKSPPGTAGKN